MPKETHFNGQRDLYACQKRPTSKTIVCGYRYSLLSMSKVICIHSKKSLRIIHSYAAKGWLRLVGSMKLQVSFAEYSLFCRALLQKRPIVQSILLTEATPYYYEKRDVCVCMRKEIRFNGKRDVYSCQKKLTSNTMGKETYVREKRDLCAWGKRPMCVRKETYFHET